MQNKKSKIVILLCLWLAVTGILALGLTQFINEGALKSDEDLRWEMPVANFGGISNNTTYAVEDLYFPKHFDSVTFHVLCPTGYIYGYTVVQVSLSGKEMDFGGGYLQVIYQDSIIDEYQWGPSQGALSKGAYSVIDRTKFHGGNLTFNITGEGLIMMLREDIRDNIGDDGIGNAEAENTVSFSLPWKYSGGPGSITQGGRINIRIQSTHKFNIYVYDDSMHILYKAYNVTNVDAAPPVGASQSIFITLESEYPNTYNIKLDVVGKPYPGLGLIIIGTVGIIIVSWLTKKIGKNCAK
ncbi:MAG: hypothetical protein L6265_02975 [Thermoplasmatales archaeon]|nr:hypothetical protein [Thermoplasmatales archaeon]